MTDLDDRRAGRVLASMFNGFWGAGLWCMYYRTLYPTTKPADFEAEDFSARIFQHEIDHTDGHVYLDRMPDLTSLGYTIVL